MIIPAGFKPENAFAEKAARMCEKKTLFVLLDESVFLGRFLLGHL
jgi:hypothetical protein